MGNDTAFIYTSYILSLYYHGNDTVQTSAAHIACDCGLAVELAGDRDLSTHLTTWSCNAALFAQRKPHLEHDIVAQRCVDCI